MKKTNGRYCNQDCSRLNTFIDNTFPDYAYCNYDELEVVEIENLLQLRDVDKCKETGNWLRHEFCLSCCDCQGEFDFEELVTDSDGLEYCPGCWEDRKCITVK